MKIQLEMLDLLEPWPPMALREGYHAMRVLVRIGEVPLGEVTCRPARRRVVPHRFLRRRIMRALAFNILRVVVKSAVAAGPEALRAHPALQRWGRLGNAAWGDTCAFVYHEILLESGLAEPYATWCRRAQERTPFRCPKVTVIVCTRDRVKQLAGCIECLLELDYPNYEILICDNSADPGPTRELAEAMQVRYVREPVAGLSRARNTALAATRTRWAAFTDDDCRPEKQWLRELVRPLQDSSCACVTGLVLPAQLENAAEITFEVYGGLGRGCYPVLFTREFLRESKCFPGATWRIGAGANMLLDRDLVNRVGGYDTDMGPGGVGGCGEDTLVFYDLLKRGKTIHYAPGAIVHHYHRSSDSALRRHIRSYAVGHAAYHWHVLWRYGDHRSLLHLCWHLPRWFARNLRSGLANETRYPASLVLIEIKGTLLGPVQYSWAKLRRWAKALWSARQPAPTPDMPDFIPAPEPRLSEKDYVDLARQKRARVA